MVGQHGKRVILVSAYRVCAQDFDTATTTSTAQQIHLLMRQGIKNPNPRQQFVTNLINQIKQWHQQNKEILISMDANEDVDDPKSKISCIFTKTDLVDLHHYHHPATQKPATHQRGSHPIDMMIRTTLFAAALTAAWMLPFGNPPLIKGNHQLLGADFHLGILFGSSPSYLETSVLRGINSHHEQHILQFCQHMITKCNEHQLDERTKALFNNRYLDETAIAELENIDQTLTKILTMADKKLCPISSVPWSPEVQQAYLLHQFWTLTRMAKRTKQNLSNTIQKVRERLDPAVIDTDPTTSLSTKLRCTQKALKHAKHEADKLRQ